MLTRPQRNIFDKVKQLVRENVPGSKVSFKNDFPASERKFVVNLSEDLNLSLTWDEFDEEDTNLVTFRLPGPDEDETHGEDGNDGEWEDETDDPEAKAAVERVLKKYEKAKIFDDDEGGGFDARHERALKEKMDEWKRNYYQVSLYS